MKNIIWILCISFTACQNIFKYSDFEKPDLNTIVVNNEIDESKVVTIVPKKPLNQVNFSQLIEEVKYIPLETTPEALIAYYEDIRVYKNYIYVLDSFTAEALFIFTTDGKFVKKLGMKGGGPEEFVLLCGFCIDEKEDQLILYDNKKRKMMYYTLNGDFMKSTDVRLRFTGNFVASSKGDLIIATTKGDGNFHLDSLMDYRLIYTDSLGIIKKGMYKYDDNFNLAVAYPFLHKMGSELNYQPTYSNELYKVTDEGVQLKYRIDLRNFTPFDYKSVVKYKNIEEFREVRLKSTLVDPGIRETKDHVFFKIRNKGQLFYSFYDKHTTHLVSFEGMHFDGDCIYDPMVSMQSNEDYFISAANPELMKNVKEYRDKANIKLPTAIDKMIENLKEDDNYVIVLFKVKDL